MSIPAKKTTLEAELENAYDCLINHLDETKVYPDQQISRYYLENCQALIFLTTRKSLIGNDMSNGILIFHPSKNSWSAPCSVFLENTYNINESSSNKSIFNVNLSETDYVLLIQDSTTLSSFLKDGKMEIKNYGNKYHIYDGPLGRNTVLSKDLTHEDKPLPGLLCYAVSKHLLKGTQNNPRDHHKWLEDQTLIISKNDNYEYYCSKIDPKYIDRLDDVTNFSKNNIPIPEHDRYYTDITELLNQYVTEPSKIRALIMDKLNRVKEQVIDNAKEQIKEEIKEEGKKELKYKVFGKPEEEIRKDELYEEHLKDQHDGSVHDTRDVKLLKGVMGRATRLIGSICANGTEPEKDSTTNNDHIHIQQNEIENKKVEAVNKEQTRDYEIKPEMVALKNPHNLDA